MTNIFVIMTKSEWPMGRNVCVSREGGYSAGQWLAYGYRQRSAAEKFLNKVKTRGAPDAKICVMTMDVPAGDLFNREDVHWDICEAAAAAFN